MPNSCSRRTISFQEAVEGADSAARCLWMMKKYILLLLLFLFAGCVRIPLLELLGGDPTSSANADAAFFDDFSDDDSGWDRTHSSAGWTDYHAKTYQIHVALPNSDLFANPNMNFKDAVVEVTAHRVDGPEDNSFGVICRYRDAQNFYAAQISSDGYAGIFRMKEGNYELLGVEKMIPAPAVLGGSAENLIRFECVGSTLILIVNNSPVDYREDSSFDSGGVGLIAGTFAEPGVSIAFDDFYVTVP